MPQGPKRAAGLAESFRDYGLTPAMFASGRAGEVAYDQTERVASRVDQSVPSPDDVTVVRTANASPAKRDADAVLWRYAPEPALQLAHQVALTFRRMFRDSYKQAGRAF